MLDEATSALDKSTEADVVSALKALPAGITILLATHRNSLLSICKNVYELDKGAVVVKATGQP